MMATSKFYEKRLSVLFEGGLQSSVRAELVTELMKYILFERQQIPLSYENLKQYSTQLEQHQETSQRRPAWSSIQKERRKMIDMINKLDQTFHGIKNAFETCPEIKLAALALGPTSVSPKEVYKIDLPPLNPEADNLPVKSCIKSLFRELILTDPLGSVKKIHPTNAVLLLYAPRESHLSWFCPKPLFKLPTRGKQFHIDLVSSSGEGSHDLTSGLITADLSGFELLDTSAFESHKDACTPVGERSVSSQSSASSSDYVCIDNSDIDFITDNSTGPDDIHSSCDESKRNSSYKTLKKQNSASSLLSQSSVIKGGDSFTNKSEMDISEMDCGVQGAEMGNNFIWYQTPVIIKGFRHKI